MKGADYSNRQHKGKSAPSTSAGINPSLIVNHIAMYNRHQDLSFADFSLGHFKEVTVEHNEIGDLSHLNGAGVVASTSSRRPLTVTIRRASVRDTACSGH